MAKKLSESKDTIALFFENVASAVERDGGIFQGDNLTAAEAKVVVSNARGLAKDFRQKADRDRSIGR